MKTKLILSFALISLAFTPTAETEEVLPKPEPPFAGKIARTAKESTPNFPKGWKLLRVRRTSCSILTDDVGFGASSVFGGPIQTPTFQRLADSEPCVRSFLMLVTRHRSSAMPRGGNGRYGTTPFSA